MAAVDVAHRNSKPLPTPRGDTYRTTRRAAPIRARKAPVQVDSDDDAASQAEIDEAEAAEPFTLVPHVAEQTLHAVHSAIFGLPFADLELVVSNSAAGKKEEIVYANSKVLKRACPALMKQINITGRAELDTMEGEQIASAVAKNKAAAAAAVSKRGAYGGRSSRLSLDDDESAHEIAGKHADEHEDEEYADSVAEQPKHHHDEEHLDHDDDGTHQDVDHFDDDDLDQDSPIASRGKVAGAAPPAPAPIEIASPPPFSRSSSRFSKLMKFVTKDRLSPSSEEAAPSPPSVTLLLPTTAAATTTSAPSVVAVFVVTAQVTTSPPPPAPPTPALLPLPESWSPDALLPPFRPLCFTSTPAMPPLLRASLLRVATATPRPTLLSSPTTLSAPMTTLLRSRRLV